MNNHDAMIEFTNLCKAGKFDEAGAKFWADEVASVEAVSMMGADTVVRGRAAVEEKNREWGKNTEVHGFKVEGPFPNGDQFALFFEFELTPKGQSRQKMTEVGLYTLKNGKIVEERFFYGA